MNRTVWIAAAAIGLIASQAQAANVVINGDFENGDVGFMSQYSYIAPAGQGSLYPETAYTVDTNANNVHNLWASFGDHTSGKGLMMIVNGATKDGVSVWDQAGDTVLANTTYNFSAWVASSYPVSPAQLEFSINGVSLGNLTLSTTTGLWQQFTGSWNSGADVTAALLIVDHNPAASGNDFVLDDIVLDTASVPEPATWALMIGGFALAGAALRRRRAVTA